jgi:hypothetical protein
MPYFAIVEFGDSGYVGNCVFRSVEAAKDAIVTANRAREAQGIGGIRYCHIHILECPTRSAAKTAHMGSTYPTAWMYA